MSAPRLRIHGTSDAEAWFSREDRARAERLDRALDAVARGDRPVSAKSYPFSASPFPSTPAPYAPSERAAAELEAELAAAAALLELAGAGPARPAEGLVALRAAIAARRATRGPWRGITQPARLALAGSGAVAAAVIGAAAWAGVSQPPVSSFSPASLVSVTEQLHQASAQLGLADAELSHGDPGQAKVHLAQAQQATAQVARQLPTAVQVATPDPRTRGLADQLAQAGSTISQLTGEVAALSAQLAATTTTVPGTATTPTSTTVPRPTTTTTVKPPPTTQPPRTTSTTEPPTTSTTQATTTTTVKPPPTTTTLPTTTTTVGSTTSTTGPSAASAHPHG